MMVAAMSSALCILPLASLASITSSARSGSSSAHKATYGGESVGVGWEGGGAGDKRAEWEWMVGCWREYGRAQALRSPWWRLWLAVRQARQAGRQWCRRALALTRVVDAGEVADLAGACRLVQALGVALLAQLHRAQDSIAQGGGGSGVHVGKWLLEVGHALVNACLASQECHASKQLVQASTITALLPIATHPATHPPRWGCACSTRQSRPHPAAHARCPCTSRRSMPWSTRQQVSRGGRAGMLGLHH